MRALLTVYSRVPRVITARHTAWMEPTRLGSSNMAFTREKRRLPSSPPAAAPRARGVPVLRDTRFSPASIARPTE